MEPLDPNSGIGFTNPICTPLKGMTLLGAPKLVVFWAKQLIPINAITKPDVICVFISSNWVKVYCLLSLNPNRYMSIEDLLIDLDCERFSKKLANWLTIFSHQKMKKKKEKIIWQVPSLNNFVQKFDHLTTCPSEFGSANCDFRPTV